MPSRGTRKGPFPFDPISGARSRLDRPGVYPYVALMQVAADDEHDNYVVCRGFDTRANRFFDYVPNDPDKKGIKVAKPYGRRSKYLYLPGQVIPAVLARTGLYSDTDETWCQQGDNPGVASVSGHPKKYEENPDKFHGISALVDDDDVAIDWMTLWSESIHRIEVTGELAYGEDSADALIHWWDLVPDPDEWNEEWEITVHNTWHGVFTKPETDTDERGCDGWAVYCPDRDRWEILWMETPNTFLGKIKAGDSLTTATASVVVEVVQIVSGYDVTASTLCNDDDEITVYNPTTDGGTSYWFAASAGDGVLCRWAEGEEEGDSAKFYVIAVEP